LPWCKGGCGPIRHPHAVERAIRAWNRAGIGYRLKPDRRRVPVELYGSRYVRPMADIVFQATTIESKRCVGRTFDGFVTAQSVVELYGGCDRYVTSLAAAHELGHVLGLAHEDDACSVMNPGGFAGRRGQPARARPTKCRFGPRYWRSPVLGPDRAGARRAFARAYRNPFPLCFQPDAPYPPWPGTQQQPLCRKQFDCPKRGRSWEPWQRRSDGVYVPALFTPLDCRPSPYDKRDARGAHAGDGPSMHAASARPEAERVGRSCRRKRC
jgi:hypothetical protein